MSYFKGLKLTKKGEQLQAKINGNLSETLTFTKAKLGSGEISGENEIRFLTGLKQQWGEAVISRCEIKNETQVEIELQFDNSNFRENKIFREIGLYARAKDNVEVLFAYSNAGENYDYIPAVQDSPHTFIITIHFGITSGTKVDATIDLNSYVTIDYLNSQYLVKSEVEELLKFNPLRQEFILAQLDDIKNLFPGANSAVGGFNLGHISSDTTKIVNLLLLSQYNDFLQIKLNQIKTFFDNLNSGKADKSQLTNYYTKAETDNRLNNYHTKSEVYTKEQVDNSMNTKANKEITISVSTGLTGGGTIENDVTIGIETLSVNEINNLMTQWR